ncbi:MAG: phosphomannomutase/phosphoglucomutase [Candidatus Curtissbacteria bacterium]|nr:phosphomannomutase/phosphoglucomutase [Candidatus Curtissbacteria bacterium]
MKVNEAIFRDYDIRGIVGEDLSDEFAYVFGKAYGSWLVRKGTKEVIVGYDARETSQSYFDQCVKGLLETGVDVIRVGLITSPMMYWARKYYDKDGGLIITASHNPPEYNGFKPASGEGALYGESLQELMRLMQSEDFEKGEGRASDREIVEDYTKDIVSKVKLAKPLKVIVDCGNSTAGPYAPKIVEAIGAVADELFCDIDFSQPNHPPDPVDPRAYPQIVEKIKEGDYDLGLLFDGDADRLGVVDQEGNVVRGDQITALCARKILKDKPGALILFELQCSKSGTDDVVNHGGRMELIRVGHSYVEEELRARKAELAGETSGHIFFTDRWYGFDDAIYAACRLLEYVSESSGGLQELVASLPSYISTPQTRIFAPDNRKFEIVEDLKKYFKELSSRHSGLGPESFQVLEIDGVRLEWEDGWAVVRASNTQPQLTLRAEATIEGRLNEIKKMIEEALAPYAKEGVEVVWGKVH